MNKFCHFARMFTLLCLSRDLIRASCQKLYWRSWNILDSFREIVHLPWHIGRSRISQLTTWSIHVNSFYNRVQYLRYPIFKLVSMIAEAGWGTRVVTLVSPFTKHAHKYNKCNANPTWLILDITERDGTTRTTCFLLKTCSSVQILTRIVRLYIMCT